MKNPPFVYHRPDSLDTALALLAEHGDDAKVLAGGQSLLPTMALRLGPPEQLIDIGRVPGLDSIDVVDGEITIGALVRHATAEGSADIADNAPLIAQAMPLVGHRAIRNRGTVVGSIAHADPAAEMPAVVLATGATMLAASQAGSREIGADEFFEGYLTTSLRADELLTGVRFPAWSANSAASSNCSCSTAQRCEANTVAMSAASTALGSAAAVANSSPVARTRSSTASAIR